MNYETAIVLAHQRMREIGKSIEQYHIEPVSIVGKDLERRNGEVVLKAYNEYYYLVNYENYYGFVILSDTGFFNADNYTENTIQEFTGLIRIIQKGKFWNLNLTNTLLVPNSTKINAVDELELMRIKTVRAIDFIKVTIH
jgi:hypothetical protein